MAFDEALMEAVRGGGPPTVRFYRWAPACLSLGRNQPAAGRYDLAAIAKAGVDVVRRPTGGRAVLHDRELTYSVVMPEGLLGSARAAYAAINAALAAGLRRLGAEVDLQPASATRAPAPSLAPCFREPAEGEVVAGGRKLIGSAQYSQGGVTLQHGSLLFSDDQRAVQALLLEPTAPDEAPAVLSSLLRPLPPWGALTSALVAGMAEVIGARFDTGAASPAEVV
ncbi:MAG: hypothetical protein KY464_07465 [Gemmatimonadetes bacterium]|nr:hypothetical protein [Gemmatimonadota bacterium]